MAALATTIMTLGEINEGPKKVFPLFQRPPTKSTVHAPSQADHKIPSKISNPPNKNGSKKKAITGSNLRQEATKGALEVPVPVPVPVTVDQENGTARPELLTIDPNDGRRKRQKTASPSSKAQTEVFKDDNAVIFEVPPPKSRRGRPKRSVAKEEGSSRQLDTPTGESSLQEYQSIPTFASITEPDQAVPNNSIEIHPHLGKAGTSASLNTANITANSNNGTEVGLPLATDGPGDASSVNIRPKKVLRFNPKTGTIGSPPPKKLVPTKEVGKKSTPKSKIVTIRYGQEHTLPFDIGQEIDKILNGLTKLPPIVPKQPTAPPNAENPLPSTNTAKPKPVHPLFTAKATGIPPAANQKPADTPPNQPRFSPRKAAVTARIRSQVYDRPDSPSTAIAPKFSGFGNPTGILKFPGAVEPAWPWAGISHVRGKTGRSRRDTEENPLSLVRMNKKGKYQAIEVLSTENIISRLATSLNAANVTKEIQEINPDEFPSVPQCLRIPDKHYEGGSTLQRRSRNELRMKPPLIKPTLGSDDEELQKPGATQKQVHPAISRVYNSIATSLSAFDQGICETQSWVQKYAPKSSSEVLQEGREAIIIREWLENLTVKAVETGMTDPKSRAAPNYDGNGKRKRKSKKLDGFVVSSDEDFDLDEMTEPEDDLAGLGDSLTGKRTVVRPIVTAKDSKRLPNAVVISGPHGCGKTAAVYAVAKELEFEVFEINSSSRRSGKDILEKVGDMSKNHLVQQSQKSTSVDEENLCIDEALAKDIESGRQGTMNSFFKRKEPPVSKAKDSKPAIDSKKAAAGMKCAELPTKPPTQQKKQSLILIEEADIIYDEDKLFWSTIFTLAAQSKRPVIITCNNESAIPLQSLLLHAIVRFTPPPVDLAVDYMLLVAACEGHVVKRDAIKVLYESRGCDLRGSLTELNFWCQFAIGDVKGGLGWSYPRWPIGSDVDQNGEKVRVVSEGTYQRGMGWLSQDILGSYSHYLDIEEEMLHEAWDGWNLDAGDWQKSLRIDSWANNKKAEATCRESDITALGIYADFVEAMSVADICSGGTFGTENQILIDIEQPVLTSRAREDYILAYPIVEALPKVDFGSITKNVSLYMKSKARKLLQQDSHVSHGFELPKELATPSETELIGLVTKQISAPEPRIRRTDFSLAFDPISEPEKAYVWSSNSLEASSFDRTITMIALDLAPYVRSIVACDARLQQERARLSNLLSEGGRPGKRMRTTRAAMSALEGGARRTTRKERYFGDKLNRIFVLHTGMESWLEAAFLEEQASRKALAPEDLSGTGGEGSDGDGMAMENASEVAEKAREVGQ